MSYNNFKENPNNDEKRSINDVKNSLSFYFVMLNMFVLSFQIEITNNDELFEMRCVILAINHIWMAHINFGNDIE